MDKNKYQNQIIKYSYGYFFSSMFFLFILVLCLIVALNSESQEYKNNILFYVIPLLSIFIIIFFSIAIQYIFLIKKYNNIKSNETINKEINCYKVKVKKVPISKHHFQVSLVTLFTKENNKKVKYYYLPLVKINYNKDYKKNLYGLKQINVYVNTIIIQSFGVDLNQYFIY